MACNSTCCAPPKTFPAVIHTRTLPLLDISKDGSAITYEDECCQPQPSAGDKDRHTGSANDTKSDGCRSPKPVEVETQDVQHPSCCEGKMPPCCDSSCIDRLALRECASEVSNTGDAPPDCSRGNSRRPCRQHTWSARDKYQYKLEALGCICRALIALGQESCCVRPLTGRPSLGRTRPGPCASATTSSSSASANPRCVPNLNACASTTKPRSGSGSVCCDEEALEETAASPCANARRVYNTASPACVHAWCNQKKGTPQEKGATEVDAARIVDLEERLSGKEHVILSISGMTCTGCETKVSRTLAKLPGVTKLRSSLILSRAEFDLDVGTTSAVEVIKHLERTTEFKCERVMNQDSSLDLICHGDPINIVNGDWQDGVTEVKMVDRKTIRVAFDAKIVGARNLLEKGWPHPMSLAPPRADPTIEAGAKHFCHGPHRRIKKEAITFGSVSLAFATIIQFVVAGPFYPKALKALIFSRVIEMDLLIILSTSAAYVFSVVAFGHLVAGKPLSTGEFFETSTLLVTLIMVGRYVAALARQKAVESISIRSLQSSAATIVDQDVEQAIDARLLQYGDVFRVLPDSKIPTDGTVISGFSEIDESMLTGESQLIEKFQGSSVVAGSINGSGILTVRLTRIPGDNTISTIAGMVDEAKLSKPKIQEIADQVATYFVPVVISITIVVFCIWIAIGITVQNKSGSEAIIQAITYAITVLIVSCPCAIGLAVPMVIVVATGVAAERGVIFKSPSAIEIAHKITHVVFDKTGTLTQGKLTIAREEYLDTLLSTKALLLGLIGTSKHPVSVAVATHLKTEGVAATRVSDIKSVTGRGVEGTFAGRILRAGNSRWLNLSDDPFVQSVLSQGFTAFCFTVDGSLAGVFGLEDSLREDSFSTTSKLQQNGMSVHILSGDDDGAVQAVASSLNIPITNVRSRCTPADKQAHIKDLLATPDHHSSGKRANKPVVMFCGDGTNDAIALAQATIGVHINEGTDVAKSAADVVLLRPRLSGIFTAIMVSRKSIHRILFNFGWSFVYNVLAILLAAGAFVHARIPPEFAGLGELVSVLPVVAAGILLRWTKI